MHVRKGKKKPMTPAHSRWVEFIMRLGGAEGCDIRAGREGSNCDGTHDLAISILKRMHFTAVAIAASVEFWSEHGGGCDCEILLNVADLGPERIDLFVCKDNSGWQVVSAVTCRDGLLAGAEEETDALPTEDDALLMLPRVGQTWVDIMAEEIGEEWVSVAAGPDRYIVLPAGY